MCRKSSKLQLSLLFKAKIYFCTYFMMNTFVNFTLVFPVSPFSIFHLFFISATASAFFAIEYQVNFY
jgi:hypothetical protein